MKIKLIKILSIVGAILIIVPSGFLIGFAASILSNLIYIIVLFPLGMGLIGAVILNGTMTKLRIRGIVPGISLGLLMTCVIYGAFHFTDYLTFRLTLSSAMNQKLVQETGKSEPKVADAFVDYALKEETGHSGLIGYVLYQAKTGISIGRWYSDRKINLGPFFTWLFWFAELAIIGWMTTAMLKFNSSRPFCEHCHNWYGKERHVGGFDISRNAEAARLIDQRNFSKLGGMLEENAELPSSEVYIQSCKTCDRSDTLFVLRTISFGRDQRLRYNDLFQRYISTSERMNMLDALQYTLA